jgi:AcrR family transcriptional regulator
VIEPIASRRSQARRESNPAYRERRERLLRSAAQVFKEKGFQAASVNDIAEAYGGDRATVYYYYGSKHEIFIDLIKEAVREVVEAAESIADADESAARRLERLIATTADLYERHYPYMYLYIQEDMRKVPGDGTSAGAELEALSSRFESALRRIVNEGIDEGVFRPTLDTAMAIFAVSGVLNWTHRWFAPGGRLSGREVGLAMADILLGGMQVPTASGGNPEPRSQGARGRRGPAIREKAAGE